MKISIPEKDLIRIIEEHLQSRLNKSVTLKDATFYQYEDYEGYVELCGYAQFQAEIEFGEE
jgi:predicted kinase